MPSPIPNSDLAPIFCQNPIPSFSCHRYPIGVYELHASRGVTPHIYEVHSTIIFPAFRVSGFSGKSRAQKLEKAQTKSVKIMGVQYNSRISTGSGVNFVLYFLLPFLCKNSHLFSLQGNHHLVSLLQSAATIPRPIIRSRYP